MSKLICPIVKVIAKEAIVNAEKIELVKVLGWQVVASKNQYNVGDLAVFFPPDSIISETLIEKYKLEFLRNGNRLKTIKLRGVFSEGLLLPLDCLPSNTKIKEGLDCSQLLDIKKYEVAEAKYQMQEKDSIKKQWKNFRENKITLKRFLNKSVAIIYDNYFKKKRNINNYFSKYTDIQNVKHYPDLFENNELVIITEKIHGTNFRCGTLPVNEKGLISWFKRIVLNQKYEFVYGSHNVQLTNTNKNSWYGEDIYGQIAKKYNLAEITAKYPNYIFFGEIFGKGVQELEYNLKEKELRIFDIKNVKTNVYLNWYDVRDICNKEKLQTVPILYEGVYFKDCLLKGLTEMNSTIALCGQISEGCVVKSLFEDNTSILGRKILKSINPEYLVSKNRTEHH